MEPEFDEAFNRQRMIVAPLRAYKILNILKKRSYKFTTNLFQPAMDITVECFQRNVVKNAD